MADNRHPSAVIGSGALIDPSSKIGPFCVIENGVTIGPDCELGPYVHITGQTELGPGNKLGTGTVIGTPPQHAGYKGDPTGVRIGPGNIFREWVSVHSALHKGDHTVIGDGGFFMSNTHIAHDCNLGNRVIMANGAVLAGHVDVGDGTFISGNAAVHQFARVGRLAMIAGLARVSRDVPSFTLVSGHNCTIRGLNMVGLERAGVNEETRNEIEKLFKLLRASDKPMKETVEELETGEWGAESREMLEFFRPGSKRGVMDIGDSKRHTDEG